jgi:environmental stress-induced protein Ves
MNWQTVRLADVLPSPWRNGGGVTRELAAWPSFQDWIWRLSVAEVARSGPFSRFDGVQRWFAVLGGAGVRLSLGELIHELTCTSAPLCFDGASPADCQLLDGATQDFNLMLRADKATAQMKRILGTVTIVLDAPKTVAVYATAEGTKVLCGRDSLEVEAHSLAWQALPAGNSVQIESVEALWMEIDHL